MMIKLEQKKEQELKKKWNMVQQNFQTSLRCVNDENCVQKSGAPN